VVQGGTAWLGWALPRDPLLLFRLLHSKHLCRADCFSLFLDKNPQGGRRNDVF